MKRLAIMISVLGITLSTASAADFGFGLDIEVESADDGYTTSVLEGDLFDYGDWTGTMESCAALLEDLKVALDELLLAELEYESCMTYAEAGLEDISECEALASVRLLAEIEYRRLANEYQSAGCLDL